MTTDDKMYFIAKHYSYLNDKGKVKAIKGNEKGYAKINKDIVRGCALLVHHMNDDRLFIDLLITPVAKSRYEPACNKAVDTFKNYFKSEVQFTKWKSCMDDKVFDRYYVDVTKKDLPELLIVIEAVSKNLSGTENQWEN
jgi:hypothetical protein